MTDHFDGNVLFVMPRNRKGVSVEYICRRLFPRTSGWDLGNEDIAVRCSLNRLIANRLITESVGGHLYRRVK
jgi:hypothetical protein